LYHYLRLSATSSWIIDSWSHRHVRGPLYTRDHGGVATQKGGDVAYLESAVGTGRCCHPGPRVGDGAAGAPGHSIERRCNHMQPSKNVVRSNYSSKMMFDYSWITSSSLSSSHCTCCHIYKLLLQNRAPSKLKQQPRIARRYGSQATTFAH
jgi:hypothetical protein